MLSLQPLTVPESLSGVAFQELREGDLDGSLSWLWDELDEAAY